jgi:two-component system LytT family response regulator
MIKVVIIDDEVHCLEVIEALLRDNHPAIKISARFFDAMEAVQYLFNNEVDLVFLDINMPVMNGFDVLDHLMPFSFKVIFTTAYDNYAIKALKYGAIDYLLKPISGVDLNITMAKYYEGLKVGSIEKPKQKRISIVNSDGITFQSIDQIMYCEAENCYTTFYLSNGKKILASKTLKDFEQLLKNYSFFRIHNSYLVNLAYVGMYVKGENGGIKINDTVLPVSRYKKDEFLQAIEAYL